MSTVTDAYIAANFKHASYKHIVELRELFAGRVGGERVNSTDDWIAAFENIKREVRAAAERRETLYRATQQLAQDWLAAAAKPN